MYRASALHLAGGFDEDFVAYLDDIDLGFRLQLLGFRCLFEPAARAHHVGGATPKNRTRALHLTERNMVTNILKNFPSAILRRFSGEIVSVHARPAKVHGGSSFLAWATGMLGASAQLGRTLAKRRAVQATRRVSDSYVAALLSSREISECHL